MIRREKPEYFCAGIEGVSMVKAGIQDGDEALIRWEDGSLCRRLF